MSYNQDSMVSFTFRKAKLFILLFLSLLTLFLSFSKQTYAYECGINIDPNNPKGFPQPSVINGIKWVRLEFKDCTTGEPRQEVMQRYYEAIKKYKDNGTKVLLIIDYMTYPEARDDLPGFAERAAYIANRFSEFGDNIAYEIWNEPDHWQGGSMPAEEYGEMLATVVSAMPESAKVISAGLASGQHSYLATVRSVVEQKGVWDLVDGVGVHPYGKQPSPQGNSVACSKVGAGTGLLTEYLNNHHSAGGRKPLWITEIGMKTDNELDQANYLQCFYEHIAGIQSGSEVETVIWFAFHNFDSFGLIDNSDRPKSSYTSFMNMCTGRVPTPISIDLQDPMPLPYTQDGPGCSPGGGSEEENKRIISGKVISTKSVERNGEWVTNQPVRGATLTTYVGNATVGTGILEGKIDGKVQTVATDGQGNFEVETYYGGNPPKYTFLYIACDNKGVDLWMIDVTEDVRNMSFYVDCNINYERAYEGPGFLSVANSRDGYLSCDIDQEEKYTAAYKPYRVQEIELSISRQDDDRFLGADPDVVTPEAISNVSLEGASQVTTLEHCNFGWEQLVFGGPEKYSKCISNANAEAEPELNQCSEWQACNRIISDHDGDPNLNLQTCGGLAANTHHSASWPSLYAIADLNEPVCELPDREEPVLLKEISPPWALDQSSFLLDSSYFPYAVINKPLDLKVTATSKNYIETDHFANIEGIREIECVEGDEACAKKPFEIQDDKLPGGANAKYANEFAGICAASNTSPLCKEFNKIAYGGGPPANLLALPGGDDIDTTGIKNPALDLPPNKPDHIQLGYPLSEYCSCNSMSGCEEDDITNRSDVDSNPNGWVNRWLWVPQASDGLPNWASGSVDGVSLASELFRSIIGVVNNFVTARFNLPGPPGSQCNPTDWGPAQCTSCINDPNGFECRTITDDGDGISPCPAACADLCYQSKNIEAGYACLGETSVLAQFINFKTNPSEAKHRGLNLTSAWCIPGDNCKIPTTAEVNNYEATDDDGRGKGVVGKSSPGSVNSDHLRIAGAMPVMGRNEPAPQLLEETDEGSGSGGTYPPGTGGPGCGLEEGVVDFADFYKDSGGFPRVLTDKYKNYEWVNNLIKTQVVDDGTGMTLAQVYSEASKTLFADHGILVPCEALAGLHHLETGGTFKDNSPGGVYNASLLSGVPITQGEANVSCPGCKFNSVYESAVVAGHWLYKQDSMRNQPEVTDHKTLANAFARYYGWANTNLNCGVSGSQKHPEYSGTCRPEYPGEDSVYAMNWVDERHRRMYEGASGGVLERAGALAVAVMLYLSN